MLTYRSRSACVALVAAIVVLLVAHPATSTAAEPVLPSSIEIAQARGTQPRELEPRYQPAPIEEKKGWYNSSYIFALTRGVAESTMVPAAKAPLFVLTVPLDLVILPIAAIGGLFG